MVSDDRNAEAAERNCLPRLLEAASRDSFLVLEEDDARLSESLSKALALEPASGDRERVLSRLSSLIHPRHRKTWRSALAAHCEDPERCDFEIECAIAVAAGGFRLYRCRAVSSGPRRSTTVVGFSDVTDARGLQEEVQAAESRIEALAGELRTLRNQSASPPRPQAVEVQGRSGERRLAAVGRAVERARSALDALPPWCAESTDWKLVAIAQGLTSLGSETLFAAPPNTEHLNDLTQELGLAALNAKLEALRLENEGTGLAAVATHLKIVGHQIASAVHDLHAHIECWTEDKARTDRALARAAQSLLVVAEDLRARGPLDLSSIRAALTEARYLADPLSLRDPSKGVSPPPPRAP